jgi:GT2 family glycosyltransferase
MLNDRDRAVELRPRVSVVTPAYNAGPFLGDCVSSVLAQTVTDLEMLVIDDGSTDETAAIADACRTRDARVRVFHQENRGVSAARNVGLAHARGEFIAFVDADDVWAPTFLADQLAILERRPDVAVVTGNALNRGGGTLAGHAVRSWPAVVRDIEMFDMIVHDDAIFIMSVFRREIPERIGGFDEALHHNEDYHFWLRAAAAGFKFVANPAPLGWYRRHSGSASSDEAAMLRGIVHVLRECRALCDASRARETAAIDRQIARFEQEYVKSRAKRAILDGNFHTATTYLEEWHRMRGGVRLQLMVTLSRVCPHIILWAYQLRLGRLRRRDR